ncbi:MAG: hypothetical protein JXQ84_06540 [Rhodospirillaceae bacterium]|nr:hypothetical protein [Rhodospirillaceae bacterium]
MPNEVRRLIFTKTEVAQALIAFNTQAKTKILAHGYLSALVLRGEPQLGVDLSLEGTDGTHHEILINESTLGAAIIRFCMDNHVPLPTKADKRLKIVNDKLVLDISLPPPAKARTEEKPFP